MAYFGGTSGRGDPGFFDTLKKIGRRALGLNPAVAAVQAVRSAFQPPRAVSIQRRVPTIGPVPRFVSPRLSQQVDGRPRRRRMNVANDKALRRAIRRQAGFVKLAKRALVGTGFKIVSSSSGKVSQATLRKAVAAAHHAK